MAKAASSTKAKVTKVKAASIKRILITQPKPETDKSPYFDLAKKYGVELDFYPFIRVEGVDGKEFRKQKIDIANFTAIIFTSRNAIDHFFRICEELKIKISQDMKYFCITEVVALYLQKFILYRKRKVFFSADGSMDGLIEVLAKHKSTEKFILPSSESPVNPIKDYLEKNGASFVEATLFKTVGNDISEVMKTKYDVIVFFSPYSVLNLKEQFPKFKQANTMFGAFGPITCKAVEDAGFKLSIKAPAPNMPSMVSALESHLTQS